MSDLKRVLSDPSAVRFETEPGSVATDSDCLDALSDPSAMMFEPLTVGSNSAPTGETRHPSALEKVRRRLLARVGEISLEAPGENQGLPSEE